MWDIIIVGAGPAGLTAALYALRANKKVLILEAKTYGGQIINANKLENYPGIPNISGFDYATNLYNQVKTYLVDNNKVIGMLTIGDLSHYYDELGEDYFCGTFEDICECGGQAKNNC